MCDRDLGDLGESNFRGWCNAAGLTVNPSEKDRTGWDFIIEFPWKKENYLPKDMLPAPIECKVQVKSTDKKDKRESIKISNLSRLVKAPLPTFYCFIEFDGKDEAQAVYLVHVDRKIIGKTLRRIRQLEAKGEGDNLNKHTIDVCYTSEERLPNITGKSLKNTIEKYISNGLEKYIADKNQLLDTLGFEEGKGTLILTFPRSCSGKDIVDLSLGLHQEICIDKSVYHDKRFDVLSYNPSLSGEAALIDIKAKPKPVILKFKEHNFSSAILLNAELYVSFLNELLAEQYFKFRVTSELIDFVVEPFQRKGKFSLSLRDEQKISLDTLKNHLKILKLLKKASHPVILEISDEAKKPLSLAFDIRVNDEINDFSDVYKIIEMVLSICQRFSIVENDILVTINELRKESRAIESLYNVLHIDIKPSHIDLCKSLNADHGTVSLSLPTDFLKDQKDKRYACSLFIRAVIGNHEICCFWAIVGSLSVVSEDKYRLNPNETFVGNELISVNNQIIEQDVVDERFNEFEQELQKMGILVISPLLSLCGDFCHA
ncbi:MAG: hypothetical protein WBG70_03965 [Spirulinaceae cyanobacterium]